MSAKNSKSTSTSENVKSVEPVLKKQPRIQTAEGWRRNQLKKHQLSKNVK